MSENTEPQTDEVVEISEPQGTEPQAVEVDWKAEARKHEKRAKENFEAAQKWHDYEQSLKPAQERLAEELAAAKSEAESARIELLRYEVAASKGIPGEAIKLLQGSSKDELEEAADVLLTLISEQSKPKSPKPDVSQGKPATSKGSTADAFASAIGDLL